MIPWEKNPDYPTKYGDCDDCKIQGIVKQAWDLNRYICLDAKACLERSSSKNSVSQTNSIVHSEITAKESISSFSDTQHEELDTTGWIAIKVQTFICESCGITWERPSSRGRPPKICSECRNNG
jgi:hypothetical protein